MYYEAYISHVYFLFNQCLSLSVCLAIFLARLSDSNFWLTRSHFASSLIYLNNSLEKDQMTSYQASTTSPAPPVDAGSN